jgi:ABC-type sugar transport system permease subunit
MTGVEKVSLVLTGPHHWERFSNLLKEKTTMISAIEILKRSYHLTEGHRWNIFWATFLLSLLAAVVAIPVGMISSMLISSGIRAVAGSPLNGHRHRK